MILGDLHYSQVAQYYVYAATRQYLPRPSGGKGF